ncbi:MAG: hypothetical protein KatS3mg102_2049 [Planctomycetota bacterium]|nr:MAG: hypothetical protein KatS3mg102_2049 [Planctomycetota bacterium]
MVRAVSSRGRGAAPAAGRRGGGRLVGWRGAAGRAARRGLGSGGPRWRRCVCGACRRSVGSVPRRAPGRAPGAAGWHRHVPRGATGAVRRNRWILRAGRTAGGAGGTAGRGWPILPHTSRPRPGTPGPRSGRPIPSCGRRTAGGRPLAPARARKPALASRRRPPPYPPGPPPGRGGRRACSRWWSRAWTSRATSGWSGLAGAGSGYCSARAGSRMAPRWRCASFSAHAARAPSWSSSSTASWRSCARSGIPTSCAPRTEARRMATSTWSSSCWTRRACRT